MRIQKNHSLVRVWARHPTHGLAGRGDTPLRLPEVPALMRPASRPTGPIAPEVAVTVDAVLDLSVGVLIAAPSALRNSVVHPHELLNCGCVPRHRHHTGE